MIWRSQEGGGQLLRGLTTSIGFEPPSLTLAALQVRPKFVVCIVWIKSLMVQL